MLKFLEVIAHVSFEDEGEPRIINLAQVAQVTTSESGGWGGGAKIHLVGGDSFHLHDSDVTRVLDILRGTGR